jgi:SulP family sulfate permease
MFKHLKGDLFGGLTAGVVALPLALAFGVQSGMGAISGLYGAIFIGFFASLFGGTNTQVSGPTAPMTAVSMVMIAGIVQANEGSLENALPAILAVFLMAGLMQLGLGALKLGKYIKYIPYPVVSGFVTGIGVIILLTQILPAIGYYPDQDVAFVETFKPQAQEVLLSEILRDEAGENVLVVDNFEETVRRAAEITPEQIIKESRTLAKSDSSGVVGAIKMMPRAFQSIDLTELIIALITILIIFGFKRITTTVPSTLVALLGVAFGVFVLDIDARKLGEIPSSFPLPNLEIFTQFDFGQVSPYIFTALT